MWAQVREEMPQRAGREGFPGAVWPGQPWSTGCLLLGRDGLGLSLRLSRQWQGSLGDASVLLGMGSPIRPA